MHTLGLGAPLVVAAVLALSGAMKLRSSQSARDSFISLKLPRWLTLSAAPALLPWGELVLAVAILVLPGWWGVAAAVVAVALMVVYLVLIVRALGFAEPVTCGCFGELGLGEVDRRTAWRNGLLVAFAAATLAAVVRDGRSPLQRWAHASGGDVGWLFLAASLVVLTWLVVGGSSPRSARTAAIDAGPEGDPGEQPLDYLRAPIPFAQLQDRHGNLVHLRDLPVHQAQLLVFLSTGCAACLRMADDLPLWKEQLDPMVAIHPVYGGRREPAEVTGASPAMLAMMADALFDPRNETSSILRLPNVPAAVLLGADGLLAGGPANGEREARDLCETVVEQVLAAKRMAASAAADSVGENEVG